jgi:hypothetical protein
MTEDVPNRDESITDVVVHLPRHLPHGRPALGVAQAGGVGTETTCHGGEAAGQCPDFIIAGGDRIDIGGVKVDGKRRASERRHRPAQRGGQPGDERRAGQRGQGQGQRGQGQRGQRGQQGDQGDPQAGGTDGEPSDDAAQGGQPGAPMPGNSEGNGLMPSGKGGGDAPREGAPTHLDVKLQQERVKGVEDEGREENIEEVSKQERSRLDYRNVKSELSPAQKDLLNQDRIPWEYRPLIKNYFQAIRPAEKADKK